MDRYVLRDRKPVRVSDLLDWVKEFEGCERRVDFTSLSNHSDVSTVFLGLDHSFGDGPPLLFETMIFGGPHDGYQERYSTWEEAEAGHAEAVALAEGGERG